MIPDVKFSPTLSVANFLVKSKQSFLNFCHLKKHLTGFFQKSTGFLQYKQRKIWNQEPNECVSGHDCNGDAYVNALMPTTF